MGKRDKRIDAYIAKAAPFARPILESLRETMHDVCPDVVETIKWSRPAFDYVGSLCGMAAFKEHMTFGFWLNAELKAQGADSGVLEALGRMESMKDLPSKRKIATVVKQAMALNEAGHKLSRPVGNKAKPVVIPPELSAALAKHKGARTFFESLPPGQQREYCDWIAGAKRDETKQARLAKGIDQLSEGKTLNWKYDPRYSADSGRS